MKSIKALVAGTSLAVGVVAFAGASSASAQTAYTVQSGDTLAKISQKYVGDYSLVNSIASANGIANPNMIYAGNRIIIPSKGQSVAKTTQASTAQQTTQQASASTASTYKKPVYKKPVYKKPVYKKQTTYKKSYAKPTYKKSYAKPASVTKTAATTTSGSNSAKEWIANKESNGSYSARSATGKYIGRYQLDKSYLKGDHSAANQERVANNYVKQRYGSWENAKSFWVKNGWY
ncbi:LysM peptidoglycan-binding domain-containing protein [Kurthia senegalensis]|uniref:aggregation-promoting factor n=1 Tax=Kurthia senegalensis TaxID=1033740 RepID=UPI000287DE80|nr:LysM peptidoglycan-binding domain-containing protein [Kurthia senegalensis]